MTFISYCISWERIEGEGASADLLENRLRLVYAAQ